MIISKKNMAIVYYNIQALEKSQTQHFFIEEEMHEF